jgi:hypothetical protein
MVLQGQQLNIFGVLMKLYRLLSVLQCLWLEGELITWTNKYEISIRSNLDRMLINREWGLLLASLLGNTGRAPTLAATAT